MYTQHPATQSNPYGCPCVTLPGFAPGPKGGSNLVGAPMVSGPWTLTFRLTPNAGQQMPVPAAQTSGGTTYTVTAVRESFPFLDIQWTASGAAASEEVANPLSLAPSSLGEASWVPPLGQTVTVLSEGALLVAPWKNPSFRTLVRVSGPGAYKLLFGGPMSDPAATFVFRMS